MTSLDAFAKSKLAQLEQLTLRRGLTTTTRAERAIVYRGGRQFVSFSCNDYLGLSQHPQVKAAAIAAIETYGTGAGASRLVTGNHPLLVRTRRPAREAETGPQRRASSVPAI